MEDPSRRLVPGWVQLSPNKSDEPYHPQKDQKM